MKKQPKRISNLLKDLHKTRRKGLAWLIDPDKVSDTQHFISKFQWVKDSGLELIFVGGSHLSKDNFQSVVEAIRKIAGKIPVVIFPGSQMQLSDKADGILFLSLISGRNPEFLIGQQVAAAPIVQSMGIEVLPTGYMLVNDGEITSVHAISQTLPIPNSKPQLAKATALAGHFLGMKYLFLDAGSGAKTPVSSEVIRLIKKSISSPLIVGGGIDSVEKLKSAIDAGADLIVLGNSIEKDPDFLAEVLDYKIWYNLSLNVN